MKKKKRIHCHRRPRGAMKYPSVKILTTQPDSAWSNLIFFTLFCTGGWSRLLPRSLLAEVML